MPKDESNTCYRIVERAMAALKARGRVLITIEKRLPVQGGLGGASANAVATLLALERALKKEIAGRLRRLRIASEVGSDLPLFLVGGTVLGVGHGEEVYPLPDLPAIACVVATPEIGVSTPKAFADWDALDLECACQSLPSALAQTIDDPSSPSDRMVEFGRVLSAWLSGQSRSKHKSGRTLSGVPVSKGRGRAETPLLDLVRTGIENDFEQVVFPKYPELREVKSVLERAGAVYASLSGSGSATYGLFRSRRRPRRLRPGCSGRCPGSGHDYADATAVLEEDFQIDDFRLSRLLGGELYTRKPAMSTRQSEIANFNKLGRRLMVGQVPLEHFV